MIMVAQFLCFVALCICCDANAVENEYHFALACPAYTCVY
jgi:hypothetical protein